MTLNGFELRWLKMLVANWYSDESKSERFGLINRLINIYLLIITIM